MYHVLVYQKSSEVESGPGTHDLSPRTSVTDRSGHARRYKPTRVRRVVECVSPRVFSRKDTHLFEVRPLGSRIRVHSRHLVFPLSRVPGCWEGLFDLCTGPDLPS